MDDEPEDVFLNELQELLDKHGVADHFFVGVFIDSDDFFNYGVGSNKLEHSNLIRLQRLMGCLEVAKNDLLQDILSVPRGTEESFDDLDDDF